MSKHIPILKLIEAMNEQPIAFNKHYVFLGCGINGALMLSQLVYWTSRTKDADGWIYKTQVEWTRETGLTRTEQENARKKLLELGFITEKKMSVPCRVFFRVERENLYKSLIEYSETLDCSQFAGNLHTRLQETCELDCSKPASKNAQNQQSNTENTTENTTESVSASARPKHKAPTVREILLKNGVTEQTASEYLNLRAKKKKPVTEKALQLVFNQAKEAKLSNERVFQIMVVRGWESFKATWNWHEINADLEQLENPKPSTTNEQQPVAGEWVDF